MKQTIITSGMFLKYALVILVCYYGIRYRKYIISRDYINLKPKLWNSLFTFYGCIIVCFTLLPITYPAMNPSGFEYNLDVSEMLLIFVNRGAIITYADNVLLFLPLTVLAYCSEYEFFRDIKSATIFSLLCSLSIELLQGVEAYARVLEDTMPVCDINDVICNTIGGILGFLLIYFYKREHNTDNKAKAE